MATIQDTLSDILKIQKELNIVGNDKGLVKELMNFTTIIYFEYSSHIILDQAKGVKVNLSRIPLSKYYYELSSNQDILTEFIRFSNIGQLSVVWNAYEKYLREKYHDDYGLEEFSIKRLFDDLINRIAPHNKSRILEEFEVLRNTRNSLHDGGKYNANFTPFKGFLCGKEFEFSPGDQVVPLRILSVVETIWSHYKEFENITI